MKADAPRHDKAKGRIPVDTGEYGRGPKVTKPISSNNDFVATPDSPEILRVDTTHVKCDGGGGSLGHPLVYYNILPEVGFIECKYCDKKFILAGSPADQYDN